MRTANEEVQNDERKDFHSFSNPEQIRITHVDLDLDVKFDQKILSGSALLTLERANGYHEGPIVLDTRELSISKCECSSDM